MPTLYDFLFIDQDRMRSLYAQLYEGLLDAMAFDSSKSTSKTSSGQLGGDPFGNASVAHETVYQQSTQESMSPHDLVLRDVLSSLTEKGLVVKEPTRFKVGSIALMKGELSIFDTNAVLKIMKSLPKIALDAAGTDSNHHSATKRDKREQKKAQNTGLALIDVVLSTISPIIQLRIATQMFEAWGAILESNMRASVANLVMQHGQIMPGEWNMLGIIDAVDGCRNPNTVRPLPPIFSSFNEIIDGLKEVFPRPDDSFCITPLVVFRTLCSE